ncbi:FAD-dependent oxidoreductase [Actinocrispum wychmicini]|uniref:Pyridine nucleotide-disulfide oxidoreductase n=1 Tax=Actinocrispum wychmicini TaxID=1213861 RepID=A0A4R2JJP7_9PSEU|nr:FAD-dependent oxidoreductase [Actinocrispum wychmicini]TCO54395.1 pyridine nucleotide-disulfide oxidoreductase [Actinocrispum wychmicini]
MPTTFVPEPRLLESVRGRHWPLFPGHGPTGRPPARADVVIVGAGPAGLAVACALWHLGVPDVVLLDRVGRPGGRFLDRIDRLDQRVLRSPYEHHPGVEGFRDCELLDFARLNWARLTAVERREVRMSQAGHRSVVPVDVFDAYCRHIAATHQVDSKTWRALVREVLPDDRGVTVRGDGFDIRADFVVLCLGEERAEAPESWWGGGEPPAGVSYWDSPADPVLARGDGRIAVVGAGLTSAHLIGSALAAGHRVDWVFRESAERFQCADVNSKFFRPEGRARFGGGDQEHRQALMRTHRRASIMFEFRPMLQRAEASGQLVVHRGRQIHEVDPTIRLSDGTSLECDHVLLALGTTVSTGRGLLPTDLVGDDNGWPDLDERMLSYRHAPRVLAVGAATAMVLGPAGRNIDGHRVATARVAVTVATGLREGIAPGLDGRTGSSGRAVPDGDAQRDGHIGSAGSAEQAGDGERAGRAERDGHVGPDGRADRDSDVGRDGHVGPDGRADRDGDAERVGHRGSDEGAGLPGRAERVGHRGSDEGAGLPGRAGRDGHVGLDGRSGSDGHLGSGGHAGSDGSSVGARAVVRG